MDILLNDRYRLLNYRKVEDSCKSSNSKNPYIYLKGQLAFYSENPLLLQQRIHDSCFTRSSVVGLGGGVLGFLFSSFIYTMKGRSTNAKQMLSHEISGSLLKQMRSDFKEFLTEAKKNSYNWAKFGFGFSIVDCFIAKQRAQSDSLNAIYSACITGGIMRINGGILSSISGCASFAAFTFFMEYLSIFRNDSTTRYNRAADED
ncbi:mitochondrial import inner membrane translocase subunit Tim22, putative [Cryptosporidium muris RN66]|uniref:Mitochondrial import inner membrane translocase subunit TIM22 n=1 Tax=Cryptosporidium muris (strain RN66) TaxID=441375 RepID=B6AHV7_CRYMR|nr:mitochondrial import inner membrane translocase subunit Tim22, putative [Cryptosporidium muris RN66]EEA07798.1 mitochondrial import inner membrane translocase subunit Tim22, putative [Cryptosporidium muris RN66]|eukprot:XP_002142147.1 mitochondrial import inner membrane translocase subunit Tim22 [Cryptosporidium muris RN66]